MPRDPKDLEKYAVKFWPTSLSGHEQASSVIPKLIQSQEKFIGILYVADASPFAWKEVLRATAEMPGNLFLKHLIVLSDVGGEKLQRYRVDIHKFFPKGTMSFRWRDSIYSYTFSSLAVCRAWTNASLRVGGRELSQRAELSSAMEDAAVLLMHGVPSFRTSPQIPHTMFPLPSPSRLGWLHHPQPSAYAGLVCATNPKPSKSGCSAPQRGQVILGISSITPLPSPLPVPPPPATPSRKCAHRVRRPSPRTESPPRP